MGHGNSMFLVLNPSTPLIATPAHAEHAGMLGAHSSSSGYKSKTQAPAAARTPFDCCALSFQPFSHPVCARNADGTGHVFDLVNIIPWLKQHNNTHPITKEPLTPADLITLHYSRKEASGEIHDPISFKPFNEHSHIVAIATTGNVFLADSIKGGKDLVNDVPFKKQDVITLQNPHGFTPMSVPNPSATSSTSKSQEPPKTVTKTTPAAAPKSKEPVPWNISPYSSGLPGASLTSTSVDPQTASGNSSKLLWDEEELMFEEISNPPKGKGKEKDIGKRRAYVRVVTSLGGSLNLELFCEKAPKTCYNFLMLARNGKYDDCLFHRLVPGFMIQTGDPTGTGAGGESYWGTPFRDEYDLKGAAKHDERGVLAMANKGAGTNGSQWYITFKAAPHLDRKHTVFGKLVGGEDVLDTLEKLPRKDGTERPAKPVKITEVIIYQDPFQDYKTRLAKKLARREENKNGARPMPAAEKRAGDDTNWFGIKIGAGGNGDTSGVSGGGVGKYLSLKRPQEDSVGQAASQEESKKKRKLGFGNFEAW
ncbi:cyclophilin peptidyl-prolyl cis-trans isomerase Cyp8 [Paramarasmius palmivorus]|uniref:RING-type E3 ubiquitin transferase n=1 Tax=Paramarasmius palmivorus TaxID=297713 RepID=A0AAW0E4A7_9AGAR